MKKYGKKKFVFESNLERSNFNISFKSECKIVLTIKILLQSLVINLILKKNFVNSKKRRKNSI